MTIIIFFWNNNSNIILHIKCFQAAFYEYQFMFSSYKNIVLINNLAKLYLEMAIVNNYFTFYLNMYFNKCIYIFMIESLSLEQSKIKCGEKINKHKRLLKSSKNKLTHAFHAWI